jgi:hypothetical protein
MTNDFTNLRTAFLFERNKDRVAFIFGTDVADKIVRTIIGLYLILISMLLVYLMRSRDSVVGIATSYGLDRGVGVRVPVGSRIFFSPNRPDRL